MGEVEGSSFYGYISARTENPVKCSRMTRCLLVIRFVFTQSTGGELHPFFFDSNVVHIYNWCINLSHLHMQLLRHYHFFCVVVRCVRVPYTKVEEDEYSGPRGFCEEAEHLRTRTKR